MVPKCFHSASYLKDLLLSYSMFQMYEFFAGIKFLSSVINAQFRANFKANRNQPKDKSLSYHEGSTLNKT